MCCFFIIFFPCRFLLVLHYSGEGSNAGASLEVTEVNIFKHLCHLALALTPASTQLKLTYLADCCKTLKVFSVLLLVNTLNIIRHYVWLNNACVI